MVAVVDLAGVGIVRGGSTLLDDITVQIDESDRWVVIGPNGAGKTTLLQVLGAQIHPTTASPGCSARCSAPSTCSSCDRGSGSPRRRWPSGSRAASGSTTWSSPPRTRWWPLARGLRRAGPPARRELLDQLGIGGLADRTFGTLSEGERKRVQIARALMTDPELLLLDEPAAGLDLSGREALVRTLSELAQDPYAPATVMVTHHVEEIPTGITHALLLKGGRLVAAGPVEDTLTAETCRLPSTCR